MESIRNWHETINLLHGQQTLQMSRKTRERAVAQRYPDGIETAHNYPGRLVFGQMSAAEGRRQWSLML